MFMVSVVQKNVHTIKLSRHSIVNWRDIECGMPQAYDAHDCMDAGGRATQGAVAEEQCLRVLF